MDGNERLGLLATVTFLPLNGGTSTLSQDDAFALVLGVAEGCLDVPDISAALE